jgi:hypothetical protein
MRRYKVLIQGVSPYSQSRYINVPKLEKEGHDAYDRRVWKDKAHIKDGQMVIPPLAIKNCLYETAKYLSEKIKGKGNSTWTKHFEAGIMIFDDIPVANESDILMEAIPVAADGVKGSGKRVIRHFPYIKPGWLGEFIIQVVDDTITTEILTRYLEQGGMFIGIGRWRPRNGGLYGRFRVEGMEEV